VLGLLKNIVDIGKHLKGEADYESKDHLLKRAGSIKKKVNFQND
jgi:hypothetical protein